MARLRLRRRERPATDPAPPAPSLPAPAPTFADPARQAAFAADGWAIVDLLDEGDRVAVADLRARLGAAPGDPRTGLFNDSWSTDRAYKAALSAGLQAIVLPRLAPLLEPHRSPMLATIVKWPGEGGAVPVHRDPTFVDEDRFRSIGVWCALDHLDEHGGTLEVVPGSHGDPRPVRIHQDPANLRRDLDGGADLLPIRLAPGQALVYDHHLLHGSRPLGAGPPRVVVSGPLVPAGAALRYAVRRADGRAVLLEVDDDFFLDHQVDALDVGAVVDRYPVVAELDR